MSLSNNNNHLCSKNNIIYIICGVSTSIAFWILLKTYYPYPNLTFDSYYYIEAAISNSDVSTWPIGYSKFIRLIGLFTHNSNAVVTIQYLLLQSVFLVIFVTIRRLFCLKNWINILLFAFLFLNPLFLYGSNHIMSDILFTALSILWVVQLIWIVYMPRPYMILTHAILLLLIFTIRYSALYYPIIATGTIILSSQSWKWKFLGIGLMAAFLIGFIQFTRLKMETVTGSRQFSYTGGWKQANNALYMYEHRFMDDNGPVPLKYKLIDSITKNYFNAPHAQVDLLEHMDATQGTWYTSFTPSPLRQYMKVSKSIDPDCSDFKQLAYFGPYYNSYGNYLIKKYPFAFARYVITPNIITYLFPIMEIFDTDNLAFSLMDSKFSRMAQKWFNLTTISVPPKLIHLRASILGPFSFIFSLVHIIFLFSNLAFWGIKYYKRHSREYTIIILLLTTICVINFFFIILVAPSVLRFQLTVFIIEFINILLIANTLIKLEDPQKTN